MSRGAEGAGPATRVVGRIRRAARSAWGFTAALLVIVLGFLLLVDELHDRANLQRQAQVAASELEQDAAELRRAEGVLMSGRNVAQSTTEIRDEIADLYAIATVLRELGEDAVASDIERALQMVESALESQLAYVLAGEAAAAAVVSERRTAPALDALEERAGDTSEYYETTAARTSRLSDIGLWISILTAGVAIGGLSWRHERARRAAQRQMEQRLRDRAAEVAEITERHRELEAMKCSFVTAVSHELRTPLTAIHGSLEMLEDGDAGALPPPVARIVNVAARGTRRLTESAGVALVLHDTHADVLCDGDRVLQALTNLVGNAIKFTSPGGSIHLGVVHRDEESEVVVRDEGRGIPPDQLEAVFDRFHQLDTEADRAQGGAGRGLTITRHIIEAQGGRIWVESEVGVGTSFRFTLPRAWPELREPGARADVPAGSVVS